MRNTICQLTDKFSDNQTKILSFTVILIFISCILYYAITGHVRGSDQYWYVTEIMSLIEGNGAVSNYIYPASVFQGMQLPRPFVHNIPATYTVLPAALILGAFKGWIVTNLAFSLLAALLIALSVRYTTSNNNIGICAGISYLLLPVTFWNTAQPLSDPAIGLLVSLAVYIYVTGQQSLLRGIFLTLVSEVLFLCKPNFILLFPFVPLAFWIHSSTRKKKVYVGILCLVIYLYLIFSNKLFVPHLNNNANYSVVDALMVNTSTYPSPMENFFSADPLKFSLSECIRKIVHYFRVQITGHNIIEFLFFYLPFNISIVSVIILSIRKRIMNKVVSSAIVFSGIYLATVVVLHNQFRYQLMAWPALLVAVFYLGHRQNLLKQKKIKAIFALIVVLGAALIFGLEINELKKSGEEENRIVQVIKKLSDTIPIDERIMLIDKRKNGKLTWLIGYTLWPRMVLLAHQNYTHEEYRYLAKNADCGWLLAPKDEGEENGLSKKYIRTIFLPAPYANNYNLYALEHK